MKQVVFEKGMLPKTASIEVFLDVILQIFNVFEALIEILKEFGVNLGGGED